MQDNNELMAKLEADFRKEMAKALQASAEHRIKMTYQASFRPGLKTFLLAEPSGKAIQVSLMTSDALERRKLWDQIVELAESRTGGRKPTVDELVAAANELKDEIDESSDQIVIVA